NQWSLWGMLNGPVCSVARCTGTRKVPRYHYVKNDTILHIFSTDTSLKKHAIRAHSLFRSLSGCLHALTARAGLPSSHTLRVISGETWPHVQELLPTVLGLYKKKY